MLALLVAFKMSHYFTETHSSLDNACYPVFFVPLDVRCRDAFDYGCCGWFDFIRVTLTHKPPNTVPLIGWIDHVRSVCIYYHIFHFIVLCYQ